MCSGSLQKRTRGAGRGRRRRTEGGGRRKSRVGERERRTANEGRAGELGQRVQRRGLVEELTD